MVDAGGPALPRPCNTVGLQNLGDVEGWGEPGSGLYLFKLEDGVYQRVAMPEIPPAPIKWVMDFRLENPYIYVRSKLRVTKWQNAGTLLASYIPIETVKLRHLANIGYVLSCGPRKSARLRLVPEIVRKGATLIPPKSTLAISLVVGKVSSAVPMAGVKIEWDVSAEGKAVGVIIRTPGQDDEEKEPPFTTRKDVRVTVEDVIDVALVHLYHPGMVIKRLLMVDQWPDSTAVMSQLLN